MANFKHGGKHTRLYTIYLDMKKRCYYAGYNQSQYYGARGIGICEEWRTDFVAFRSWAIANGYSDGLSIDRIDTNKGYEPSNCRWATPREQARNRRNNILIKTDGRTICLMEWCQTHGVKYSTMLHRLKNGWTQEEATSRPVRARKCINSGAYITSETRIAQSV